LIDRRTGKPVGPITPIAAREWPFGKIAGSEILWRYMDFWKFESVLTKSALFFTRQDLFTRDPTIGDVFEGVFSKGNAAGWSDSDQAFYDAYPVEQSPDKLKEALEIHRQCTFVSCWHRNTKESREMWNAYTGGPESLVVTTSAKALERFVRDHDIMKSPVRYHGEAFRRSLVFGWSGISFYKPSRFAFEREFRMVRPLRNGESVIPDNKADYGRFVPIRPRKIIHRVITHPRATDTFKKEVDALMSRFLKARKREDSTLLP